MNLADESPFDVLAGVTLTDTPTAIERLLSPPSGFEIAMMRRIERRRAQVLVRLGPAQAHTLDCAAARLDVTRQDIIRQLIDEHLPPGPPPQCAGQLSIDDAS